MNLTQTSAPRQQAWALPQSQSLGHTWQCEVLGPMGTCMGQAATAPRAGHACILHMGQATAYPSWACMCTARVTGQYSLCRHEYGEAALTLELVDSMDEAIDHIHAHGSGHTEAIITGEFYKSGGSACVWLPRGRQRLASLVCRACLPCVLQQDPSAV